VLRSLAGARGVMNDHHARRDPDPASHRHVPGSERSDRRAQFEARPDGPLGIVFMRLRLSEQNKNIIADTVREESAIGADAL
jgi:hypothetical protein